MTTPIVLETTQVTESFYFREKDGKKRETVQLTKLPKLTVTGVLQALDAGGKVAELVLDTLGDVFYEKARAIVDANEAIKGDADFPYELLDWVAIANAPKPQKGRVGIPKELFEAFYTDYITTMGELGLYSAEKLKGQVAVFKTKFVSHKGNKKILAALQGLLTTYLTNSQNAAQFEPVLTQLTEALDLYLNTTEEELLASIM